MVRFLRSSKFHGTKDETSTASHRMSLNAKPASATASSSSNAHISPLKSDRPVTGQYGGGDFCIGGGVAIFHVASARVVVCQHSAAGYYFLPKGRRDVLEESGRGAEREGYEESGYRNRLLPLPVKHRQPLPHHPTAAHAAAYSCEPVWTSVSPMNPTLQYILHWYIAETLPPELERELDAAEEQSKQESKTGELLYQYPPAFPLGLSLKERLAMEPEGYEPPRHTDATVQPDELKYVSFLLPIDEAMRRLEGVPVMVEVVRRGWDAIQRRMRMEKLNLPGRGVL